MCMLYFGRRPPEPALCESGWACDGHKCRRVRRASLRPSSTGSRPRGDRGEERINAAQLRATLRSLPAGRAHARRPPIARHPSPIAHRSSLTAHRAVESQFPSATCAPGRDGREHRAGRRARAGGSIASADAHVVAHPRGTLRATSDGWRVIMSKPRAGASAMALLDRLRQELDRAGRSAQRAFDEGRLR